MKEYTLELILMKNKVNTRGLAPIYFRHISDRLTSYKSTKHKIPIEYWDDDLKKVKKGYPNYDLINHDLSNSINEINKVLLNPLNNSLCPKDLFEQFFNETIKNTVQEAIQNYYNRLNKIKKGPASYKYKNLLEKFIRFSGNKPFPLAKFNKNDMEEFRIFLENEPTINSKNTIARTITFLKTSLKYAHDENKDVDRTALSYKSQKARTIKPKLTIDEFRSIENLQLSSEQRIDISRDVFMLQVYLRGIRISDVLTVKNNMINGGEYVKEDRKTDKINNMKVRPEAQILIDKYAGKSKYGYVLPLVKMELPEIVDESIEYTRKFSKHIQSITAVINRNLKVIADMAGIEKNLTSHVARHTFASLADKSGLNSRVIQKLLNHSSLSQTESYLAELRQSDELDRATDQIFG